MHSKFSPQLLTNPFRILSSRPSYCFLITMSSANCPFALFPKIEEANLIYQKDWYITIDIPLDPSNPNSQKITHKYLKLNSTEIEEVLEFFSTFGDIVKTLALPSGPQQF